jgi:ADP-ribose pyrophosphatase
VTRGETVFEARKFSVERRSFEHAGQQHTYEIVVHPGAAVILPVLDDGRIVLIANHRLAVGEELLELPAGTIDPGEDPEVCARRELTEETGYTAGRVRLLARFYASPGIMTELMYTYLATSLTAGPTAHEASERIRVTPMTHEETMAGIRDGRIKDAKTMATLLYYDRFARGEGDR